jgi:putative tricarboxylic transport membrane protein
VTGAPYRALDGFSAKPDAALLCAMAAPADRIAWRPQHAIEIVAGTPPGGGLDRTARALARAIESTRLLDVPVKVINIPGDGARKAWTYVEQNKTDPHVLAISSPNLTTDRLTGIARFDHSAFTPLAILYNEYIAFIARSDSEIADARSLLHAFATRASSLTIALSTALGNPNHIALAKVIRHAGADVTAPKLHVFDSALDALEDSLSGRADVAAITAASAVEALAKGAARALAVSAPQRLSGLYADAPAWVEYDVDCVVGAWRGVTGPHGLSEAHVAYWQSLLDAAVATQTWTDELSRYYWTRMYLTGDALGAYMQREDAEFGTVLAQLGLLRVV